MRWVGRRVWRRPGCAVTFKNRLPVSVHRGDQLVIRRSTTVLCLVERLRSGPDKLLFGSCCCSSGRGEWPTGWDGQRREPSKRSGELVSPGPGVLAAEPVCGADRG